MPLIVGINGIDSYVPYKGNTNQSYEEGISKYILRVVTAGNGPGIKDEKSAYRLAR